MSGWEHGVVPNCIDNSVLDGVERAVAVSSSEQAAVVVGLQLPNW